MGRAALSARDAVRLREATAADTPALFEVFRTSVEDLLARLAHPAAAEHPEDAARARAWKEKYAGLFGHLATTAEACWVAEDREDVIGYARTTMRDGLRELTELFVVPGAQSAGLGARLLERAFPAAGAEQRMILATVDPRALARYLGLGLTVRDVVFELGRAPRSDARAGDGDRGLAFTPLDAARPDEEALEAMSTLDDALFGHRREIDLHWLATDRAGFVAGRDGAVVGYGFVGAAASGPIAARDHEDVPVLLAHAERLAAAGGQEWVGFHLPGANAGGIDHLLRAGYRLDPFQVYVLSEHEFGGLDRYVISGPTFFL